MEDLSGSGTPLDKHNKRNTRLQIVPWSSKNEWQDTFNKIYSEDIELQEKAYNQMCIWKARNPNLPLGVECTMSMLHVRLLDRPTQSPTYRERDLQMLYSTAVMRFLNHLTTISNQKDSMYKMAESHKIPDWLINLRHEAAHGNSIPALYLLRKGRDFIWKWLKENYWETEAEIMEDVVRNKENEEYEQNKIRELLNLWVVLKLNYWSGRKTIDKIPEDKFRIKAQELADEEGVGMRSATETPSKNRPKVKRESAEDEVMIVDDEVEVIEYTHKIKTAFEPLLRKLFEPLRGKAHRKVRYQRCLMECLVNFRGFCLQLDPSDLEESTVLELMIMEGELWKEVVEGLQDHGLLDCLLQELSSPESQTPGAQLWLRLLTELLSGRTPPSGYPITHPVCQLFADNLPGDVVPEMLLNKDNFHPINHQRPISLRTAGAREIAVLQKLAHKAVDAPTKFSNTYLPYLLEYWETPLTTQTKEKLCALARIYNGQGTLRTLPTQVYTLASLLDHGLDISEVQTPKVKVKPAPSSDNDSPWQLYSGDADWSRCALGALPWQC